MNIKTFIAWAVLTALVGCAITPPEEGFRPEGLPPTAAGIPGGVQLFWNPSPSTNVGGYKVSYGQTSGNYTLSKDAGNVTTASVTGLTEGAKYYFAVKAYDTTRTVESPYSNEISYTMPAAPVTPPPTANFTASPTSGYASLAVNFTPVTTGTVTSWKWDFPGSYTPTVTNTTAQVTTATYANPGTYSATLTVTGPGGTATKTAPNLITVAAATGTPPPTTPPTTPTPPEVADSSKLGLVAAYGFEEPSGATVVDASGKGNHGTITKATRANTDTPAAGNKKGLVFNGVDSWITVKDSASLDLSTGLTLEAWVWPTVTMTNFATVALKEKTGGLVYSLFARTNSSQFGTINWIGGGERYLTGGTPLLPNQWWHIVATYDGQNQILYVNGVEVAKRAQTGTIQTSTGALRIGGNSIWPGEFFPGVIDELRIYNRALTPEEIGYNKANSVIATNPPQFVMGDKTVEPTWNDIPQGTATAYRTIPQKSGAITNVNVYLANGSTATELVAGIYNDNYGHPGTRVTQARSTTLKPGWNSIPIPVVLVTAGRPYWIALLGSKGVAAYQSRIGSGTGSLETSASTTLTSLPSTWTRAKYWSNSAISVTGLGYLNQ